MLASWFCVRCTGATLTSLMLLVSVASNGQLAQLSHSPTSLRGSLTFWREWRTLQMYLQLSLLS